ncbi:MAG: helix-turn-helix transcriptional regulator [Planctomycetes bacterium]|nr:helix-turn-helix transcriptional regulator [Planctomycetota bacterium]NUQ34965.1 helix-turn-helix transcriptional regulator [Planctomycetaceae bacterium]
MKSAAGHAKKIAQDEETIRQRLTELAAEHSQAALARATGLSNNRIHYYLRGKRIPASVCSALVRELGVNPAWLIGGEGAPYLADVETDEAVTATGLLALVERLNALSRMRLGALAGKDNTKIFRQLNDSLTLFRELKESLSAKARPVLSRLLDEFEDNMINDRLRAAQGLCKSIEQVLELCNDDELTHRYERSLARLEYRLARMDRATAMYQRVFARSFLKDGALTEDDVRLASQFVTALHSARRNRDARRLANVVLALCEGESKNEYHHRILFQKGYFNVDLGNIAQADQCMRPAFAALNLESRRGAIAPIILVDVLMGIISLQEGVDRLMSFLRKAADRGTANLIVPLLLPAIAFENQSALKKLTGALPPAANLDHALGDLPFSHANIMISTPLNTEAVTRHLKRDSVRAYAESDDVQKVFLHHVLACQLHRLAGSHRQAVEELQTSEKVFQDSPERDQHRITVVMLHCRNTQMLLLKQKRRPQHASLLDHAQKYLEELYQSGYACLKPWVGTAASTQT